MIDKMLHDIAEREALDVMREWLADSVALVPPNIDLIHADKLHEEWSVATQIGAIPLIFYYNGIVVLNTAPYDADALAWISDKARLMELTNR